MMLVQVTDTEIGSYRGRRRRRGSPQGVAAPTLGREGENGGKRVLNVG
jgi:hypothetical protein